MASLDTNKSSTSRSVLRWYKGTTGSLRDVEQYKSTSGASSLEDAALRCILRHLDSLDHTHLSSLPWTMRQKVWAYVKRLRLDSIRTWQVFARAFSQEQEAFYESKKALIDNSFTPLKFDFTFKKVTAPNFEWVVHLALEDSTCTKSEWCAIKSVSNLASLLVYNRSRRPRYHAEIDDRVIKAWVIAAREEGAFSKLRVLHVHNSQLLTCDSLLRLAYLPAFKVCHVLDCNVIIENFVRNDDWLEIVPDDKAKDGVEQMWYLASVPFLLDLYYGQSFSWNPLASRSESKTNARPELFLYDQSTVELNAKKHLWLVRNAKQQQRPSKEADIAIASEPEPKKRKVRATKEKNLGEFLGQMGV